MSKLTLNTKLTASSRAVARAMIVVLLPERDSVTEKARNVSDTVMRSLMLDIVSPATYNYAKIWSVKQKLTVDFSRSAGMKPGKKVKPEEKLLTALIGLRDTAIEKANVAAREADLVARISEEEAMAKEAADKEAKLKEKADKKAEDAKVKADAKASKTKEKADAKALKAKETDDAKAAKTKAKADKKAEVEKVAKEKPEMKWQIVNKETNEVLDYAPGRKEAIEFKNAHKDVDKLTVKKIPATA